MAPLSVFVIARNEAANLARLLPTVAWADEVLLVDSGSDDGTVALARRAGARIVSREWRDSFGEYKEAALRLTTHRWVLHLDADEAVTPELRAFVETTLAGDPGARAYAFRRKTFFGEQWIRGLGWYPDYVVRLFPKDRVRFSPDRVHERIITDLPVVRRPEEILHHSYRDRADFERRAERYATLWARTAAADGKRASLIELRSAATFLRCYLLRAGFRDGAAGLLLSRLYARYTRRKYELLRELTSTSSPSPVTGAGEVTLLPVGEKAALMVIPARAAGRHPWWHGRDEGSARQGPEPLPNKTVTTHPGSLPPSRGKVRMGGTTPTPPSPAKGEGEQLHQTVIVRAPNWLGDAVIALPALRGLRAACPAEWITVLAHRPVAPLYEAVREVNEVIEADLKTAAGKRAAIAQLRGRDFARGVVFPNSWSAAWLLARGGVRERWGAAGWPRSLLLTRTAPRPAPRTPPRHQAEDYVELVEKLTGTKITNREYHLEPTPAGQAEAQRVWTAAGLDGKRGFALHPGAAYGPAKRWPAANFRSAAEAIQRRTGLLPVLFSGAGEEAAAREALPDGGVDLAGKLTLAGLLAAFARCAFFLGNDSGPMHLAAAVGLPVVAIFASTSPEATGPLGDGHQVLVSSAPCRPCFDRTCDQGYLCQQLITPEMVVAAALRLPPVV